MIKKDKEVIEIIKLINSTFGNDVLTIKDYWNDYISIGLKKGNKLIYIACYGKNDYFYEYELLVDNPDIVYISQGSDNVMSKTKLLKVISDFFNIKIISDKTLEEL